MSEEESHRTVDRGRYYAILPMLLELRDGQPVTEALEREYSSVTTSWTARPWTTCLPSTACTSRTPPAKRRSCCDDARPTS